MAGIESLLPLIANSGASTASFSGVLDSMSNMLGNLLGTSYAGKVGYKYNQRLQDDAQSFNANEALLNRDFSSAEAQKVRDFNALEAQKQRDFEYQMSSTAYQRALEDMRAAGINPAAIGMQGGASTPSGAAATGSNAQGSAASSNANHVNVQGMNLFGGSDMFSSAFRTALAHDKSFQQDYIRNLSHSARKYGMTLKQSNQAIEDYNEARKKAKQKAAKEESKSRKQYYAGEVEKLQ